MFRRAAGLLDFMPRDGDVVEVRGRLGVYEPRGDLQLIVESLARAGRGALFEQFLRLKARLEAEGLFDPGRKRPVPLLPRGIGLVTSLGAAALHDVATALQRRSPHVPVILSPAAVQGSQAPAEIVQALQSLYRLALSGQLDVILLVRGGGAMEDLWAFNDEQVARTIVLSPVPLICGVGHESDFTIADFCADLRTPTPTAAAELCAQPQQVGLAALDAAQDRLQAGVERQLQANSQRLDWAASRVRRPSHLVTRQQARLASHAQSLRHAMLSIVKHEKTRLQGLEAEVSRKVADCIQRSRHQIERAQLRLELLDPKLVLQRGYAWVTDGEGRALTRAQDLALGQKLRLHLSQGQAEATVSGLCPK